MIAHSNFEGEASLSVSPDWYLLRDALFGVENHTYREWFEELPPHLSHHPIAWLVKRHYESYDSAYLDRAVEMLIHSDDRFHFGD